jgi:hypothetical protein
MSFLCNPKYNAFSIEFLHDRGIHPYVYSDFFMKLVNAVFDFFIKKRSSYMELELQREFPACSALLYSCLFSIPLGN